MMGELGTISNLGGQTIGGGATLRPQPDVKVPQVVAVEAGSKGRDLSADLNADPRKGFADDRFRGSAQDRQSTERRLDPAQIPGPSPAFQASVLELEQDLQNTIARVEAARGKRESDAAQGIRPPSPPPETEEAANSRQDDRTGEYSGVNEKDAPSRTILPYPDGDTAVAAPPPPESPALSDD